MIVGMRYSVFLYCIFMLIWLFYYLKAFRSVYIVTEDTFFSLRMSNSSFRSVSSALAKVLQMSWNTSVDNVVIDQLYCDSIEKDFIFGKVQICSRFVWNFSWKYANQTQFDFSVLINIFHVLKIILFQQIRLCITVRMMNTNIYILRYFIVSEWINHFNLFFRAQYLSISYNIFFSVKELHLRYRILVDGIQL